MEFENVVIRKFELPYGFMIEVVKSEECWDVWLYHKNGTIKEYLVGCPKYEEAEAFIEREDIFTELVRYHEDYMR